MSSLKELQDLIQEKYGIDPATLDPQESMREKGFDSLAIVEFLFEVEDRLKVSLPDPDPSIETLAGLAAVVDRVRAEQQQAAQQEEPSSTQGAGAEPPAAAANK